MPADKVEALNAEPWCHEPGCSNITNLTVVTQGRRGRLVVYCKHHAEQHLAPGAQR
jgi:hypothetical protein